MADENVTPQTPILLADVLPQLPLRDRIAKPLRGFDPRKRAGTNRDRHAFMAWGRT